MSIARRGSSVLLLIALGCKPGASNLPGWEDSTAEGGAPTAPAAQVEPAADEGVPGDETPTTDPVASDAPDPAANTGGDEGAAATDPAEPEPEVKAGKPLPSPVHTRKNAKCGKDPGVGQRLKPFKLKTPEGKAIGTGTYKGRVLLVNFWGTWCKPCLKELPEFDQLYRRYRGNGLTLVAVATDEDPVPVQDFARSRKLAARIALGGEAYAGQYGSDKFPFTFVVDHKGVIKASYRGYKPECMGQLESDIRTALEKRGR